MADLPEYYERPPRGRFLFTWTGDNLTELTDFLATHDNRAISPETIGASLRYDADGSTVILNPGEMILVSPGFSYPRRVTAEQLADGYAPIDERPLSA